MRIISDFKDYYDVGMGLGYDSDLVYKRFPREVEDKYRVPYTGPSDRYKYQYSMDYTPGIIGFCGKLYSFVTISMPADSTGVRADPKICYKIEEVDNWVENHFKNKTFEEYQEPINGKYTIWDKSRTWKGPYRKWLTDQLAFSGIENQDYAKIFEEQYSPIFFAGRQRWDAEKKRYHRPLVFDGCLKDFEFFRVMDPYQTFQQIAMFMGNLAAPEKPIPELDDVTMAEIKGFNKESFRKPPSGKKKR